MAVTEVGTPAAVAIQSGTNTGSVPGTWGTGQSRTAGHLLVAEVTAWGTTSAGAIAGPGAPWSQAVVKASSTGRSQVAIFVATAAGADAAPTFTSTMTGTGTSARMSCYLRELAGQNPAAPVFTTGTGDGSATTLAMASLLAVPAAGCFAIGAVNVGISTITTNTYSADTPDGWVADYNTASTSARSHSASDSQANPAAGAVLNDAPAAGGTITEFNGVMIIVAPPFALLPQQIRRRAPALFTRITHPEAGAVYR